MKKAKITLILLLSFFLNACTSSFVYNNIDWLLYWYVGDYVDLTSDQKATLDEYVASWHHWHRSTELKKYQAQLKNLQAKLPSSPLNQEQWLTEFYQAQQHFYRFRNEIAPELAAMAQQLSAQQLEGLLVTWKKKNLERQSENGGESKDERLISRQKDLAEQLEENIGKLTPLQIKMTQQYAQQFASTSEQRMLYQSTLQQVVRKLFAKQSAPEFQQQLTSIISNPDQYKTPEYKAASEQNKRLYAQMLADLNLSLTEKQKQTLNAKLEDWIRLIDKLILD
ncbi:DUF6279 family lipoprotein [Marinomonas transparens]|uniref:Lipoprotein n=1 Tax=Marinomonas transparens TaxID=2795388 RepID=A0A934N842_9GAMM|nr:DUF6279 family lipoprotein [Marinomonas transparens]MBJ7539681.1 hypothetical protein [Marinomonas transparens]